MFYFFMPKVVGCVHIPVLLFVTVRKIGHSAVYFAIFMSFSEYENKGNF